MEDTVVSLIQTAVTAWSRQRFASDDVLLGQIALDDDEERYLVDVAARPELISDFPFHFERCAHLHVLWPKVFQLYKTTPRNE